MKPSSFAGSNGYRAGPRNSKCGAAQQTEYASFKLAPALLKTFDRHCHTQTTRAPGIKDVPKEVIAYMKHLYSIGKEAPTISRRVNVKEEWVLAIVTGRVHANVEPSGEPCAWDKK